MRFPGFIGPSYTLSSVNYECQRTINMYPELNELGTGKDAEVGSLIGTPGLSLLASIGAGPHRGSWFTSTGVLYVVSGNTVYNVTSSWVATSVGTLQTSTGQVSMADNGYLNGYGVLVIVDGPNGYYVNLTTNILTQITDLQWLGSNLVSYQDGYFIFCAPNSNEFYLSDLNAITFTAPANATKDGYPDNVVSFLSSNRYLWLFGDQTTEIWYNSGNNLTPFEYIQGSFIQYGCAATFGSTKMANTVFWLGKDQTGNGIVFIANGQSPSRISTHAVELAFQSYSTISDAIAWSYQENGHLFFVLTFPTANATWVYDTTSSLWHERASLSSGSLQRHRANTYTFAYNTHVVGDYVNGNLYSLTSNAYSDNGAPIVRQRVTPHLSKDMVNIFFQSFQLDIESGTGLDGIAQGTTPQVVLQWSNDGGHSWSNEIWTSFGKIGATRQRAIFRRLGHSRNRVFKVTITDPVKVVMMGAELHLEQGVA
jgi:hypothetical protein